jgi:uncharacterized repeat protein (TIGR01451 family)
MNTQYSRLFSLSVNVALLAAVTLLVAVLSLQASRMAYALPADTPALAPQNAGPIVVATVPVGDGPGGVGVNPTTNRVYVANYTSNSVSVIDGASHTVIATVPVSSHPWGVGVNPTTNRVYVVNGDTVSVIDGASNTVVATVPVGSSPRDIGVNPTTNRVYVTNNSSNTVSVIDGASNTVVATVPVGSSPNGVGVNPTTNRVYVTNAGSNTVSVIDGASNTVVATVPVGSSPRGIGVNPTTNRVYVSNFLGKSVSVIDGATNIVIATRSVGNWPYGVGVNPTANRIYVANYADNTVSVIDGASNTVVATVPVGWSPLGAGANPATNRAYVANEGQNTVSVIQDGAVPGPQVALTKSVSPTTARPGDRITYTIAFSNTGAVTATHVLITDTLSVNLTQASYTSSGVALTQVPNSQYAWTAPDLRQNDGGVITITGVLTKPLAAGRFTNTVTLAVSGTVKTANAPLTVQNVAPVANAGIDQSVGFSQTVTLNGSGTDDNGDALTYGWTQTGGAPVTLSSATVPKPTFIAPATADVLTFTLTITDTSALTDTDQVVVTVRKLIKVYLPIVLRAAP